MIFLSTSPVLSTDTLPADDPFELSNQITAPGILKIFGNEICEGAHYKSVLATTQSNAKELVKEALERWEHVFSAPQVCLPHVDVCPHMSFTPPLLQQTYLLCISKHSEVFFYEALAVDERLSWSCWCDFRWTMSTWAVVLFIMITVQCRLCVRAKLFN